ncbi:MAG: class B sortase, partial [Lachnospiraceae bacterium]|nr:class B sortase [Lachnospiraceae bacterium]
MRRIQALALVILLISVYVFVTNISYTDSDADSSAPERYIEMEAIETDISADELSELCGEIKESNIYEPFTRVIDFDAYREINADVYAYIYIPNTEIDYPILQHESDNSYYLNYNIDNTKGYPGCIYTEKENSKDFTDSNTIIYGHNMKDGSMFHDIHLFDNSDFFENNKYIYIYTPEKVLQYEIFAVYTATDDHLLYLCDFNDRDEFGEYLNQVKEKTASNMYPASALVRQQTELSADDHIISLQTCTSSEERRT